MFIDDDCIAYKNTLEQINLFLMKYPFVKCLKGDPDSLDNASLIDRYLNAASIGNVVANINCGMIVEFGIRLATQVSNQVSF